MKFRLILLVISVCLLTGCASLLEREYSTSEPHSSKFWESEAAGTLRAENYQDVVNDMLLLIGQHRETATLFLYNFTDDLAVADTLERAAVEIQQETPLGAYAVEYITSSAQAQHGYYETKLQIGYRRTPEQLQAVVNATSPEALYSLLEVVLDAGGNELAVRIGYWGADGKSRVESAIQQIREDRMDRIVFLIPFEMLQRQISFAGKAIVSGYDIISCFQLTDRVIFKDVERSSRISRGD